MVRASWIAFSFAFSLGLPAKAEVHDVSPIVCLDEQNHIKPKFNRLLHAASERNFSEFLNVNGSNSLKRPKFVGLEEGNRSAESVFTEWADLSNSEKQSAILLNWHAITLTNDEPPKAFLARIIRSEWNVSSSASERVVEEFLIIRTGCDIFLVQETDFPQLEFESFED